MRASFNRLRAVSSGAALLIAMTMLPWPSTARAGGVGQEPSISVPNCKREKKAREERFQKALQVAEKENDLSIALSQKLIGFAKVYQSHADLEQLFFDGKLSASEFKKDIEQELKTAGLVNKHPSNRTVDVRIEEPGDWSHRKYVEVSVCDTSGKAIGCSSVYTDHFVSDDSCTVVVQGGQRCCNGSCELPRSSSWGDYLNGQMKSQPQIDTIDGLPYSYRADQENDYLWGDHSSLWEYCPLNMIPAGTQAHERWTSVYNIDGSRKVVDQGAYDPNTLEDPGANVSDIGRR